MSGSPRIALVAAVAANGVIGADQSMPWRLSSDMKRFKRLTAGKPVVMGRRTFETLGGPLPERDNIVVTSREDYAPEGVHVVHSLDEALSLAAARGRESGAAEIMVIGGGAVYAATIDRAERLYVTHVEASPEGDTRFPEIDRMTWQPVESEAVPAGERDSAPTVFTVYERVEPPAQG